jgi:hypothetical protein
MLKKAFKPVLATLLCLLLLGAMLLVAGCGNFYQSPGSPNNGNPQATPTKGGYSLIIVIDKELHSLLPPYMR